MMKRRSLVYAMMFVSSLVAACNTNRTTDRSKSPSQALTPSAAAPVTTNPQVPATQAGPIIVQPTQQVNPLDCYKADPFICEIEKAILKQTNEYRATKGKDALAYGPKMSFVSRAWSQSQANRGFIGHAGFPSSRYKVFAEEFAGQPKISMSAENVAYSGSSSKDAERVAKMFADMWWGSSGHKANMLGRYKTLGVGVYKKGSGTYYATQIFGQE